MEDKDSCLFKHKIFTANTFQWHAIIKYGSYNLHMQVLYLMHKLKGRYFCVNARGKQLIRRCLHDTLICFDLMQIFLVINLAIKTVVKIINNPLPFSAVVQGI